MNFKQITSQTSLEFQLLEGSLEEGVILADKPRWWSSFDVIRAFRRQTGIKKVGHAGTLDPLATGALILCTGKKTKQISRLQEQPKAYEALFCLGATTPSLDSEFDPEEIKDCSEIGLEMVQETIQKHFLGAIQQTPPAYSAVKVNGKRAYELARQGREVKIEPKEVIIFEFNPIQLLYLRESEFWPFHELCRQSPNPLNKKIPTHVAQSLEKKLIIFRAKIVCSKGTYIRSLAHDIGTLLGVSGFLIGLNRTRGFN
jgi:tRNA pseudouridine55 synthase